MLEHHSTQIKSYLLTNDAGPFPRTNFNPLSHFFQLLLTGDFKWIYEVISSQVHTGVLVV